jgi:cell division protein FtsW
VVQDRGAEAGTRTKAEAKPDRRIVVREYDHIIFISTIVLVAFGLVMVLSASSYAAMHSGAGMYSFFITQAFGAGLGFIGMIFAATINYQFVSRFSGLIYLLALVALGLVFTPLGIEHNGAMRWVSIEGFNFQPSELAKVAVIIMLSKYISDDANRVNTFRGLLGCAIIVGIPIVLVMLGRNMSTMIILGAIAFVIIFLASSYFWRWVALGAAAVTGIAGYLLYEHFIGEGFRGARFGAWLDPFADPTGSGFQNVQSLYAVASGGLFGLGLGNSNQKLYYLPEAQNDFIFAIIVEELGLFGAMIVLMLFGILIWRGATAAINSRSVLGCLIGTGIITMISVQVIINVGVVTNTIPNTGIPLPFISYGGTSIAVMMTAIGVLLNISRYRRT